ncbi:AAA family ATPase [Anaerobacillus sp. HL2]|nr:AAA family ATPase [Anaerobacillus sp. HL2]
MLIPKLMKIRFHIIRLSASNIITQNALLVSDYYLIPTIMDDVSSNGINHLINVIDKSVYQDIYDDNKRVIEKV